MRADQMIRFRDAILTRKKALRLWLDATPASRRSLALGPCGPEEAEAVMACHEAALERLEGGGFGVCRVCQGEVEAELLELDFTQDVCLDDLDALRKRGLERDLELAAKVQRHLLPQRVPEVPGVEVAALTRPAEIVGGDYFDFYTCPDGSLGVAVADVMGKGLSSSLLMSSLQASLRILGPETMAMDRLAARLNDLFRYNLRVVRFISMVMARFDPGNRCLTYCNAGHNPGLLRRADGTRAWLAPTGPALGLTAAGAYRAMEVPVSPGDLLILYTDGLTEAGTGDGREFGAEGLAGFLDAHAGEPVEVLLAGLREAAERFGGGFRDDVTLVALRFS
ncbi:MAG TPA: PP2C family protein-serine/threonine phosphatase [Holophagaceae bacterium]